jgi:predicted nucleic acid-binding protein
VKRFFVDANVFVYAAGNSRFAHGSARVLRGIAAGAPGTTSTTALEELWHLELSNRMPGLDGATRDAYEMIRPALPVTDDILRAALDGADSTLGANDRVHVATCRANDIDVIVSADRSFDEAAGVRRVDPSDLDAVEELLTDK